MPLWQMLLFTQWSIRLLHQSVCVCVRARLQYWTVPETGRLPRGRRPLAGIHNTNQFPLRLRCLEHTKSSLYKTRGVRGHKSSSSPTRSYRTSNHFSYFLPLITNTAPVFLSLPQSQVLPVPALSPLRTHSPEWMLMVVPTRLLFLCLFSQRKSRALRAWACDKGRVLYRLTRKNLSAAALHSLKDYRNWLCAYSAVYCCQELKQCGAQRKPKKNTCNQNNADLKKKN